MGNERTAFYRSRRDVTRPRAARAARNCSAHAHRGSAANRSQSNGISVRTRHGTTAHDVVHGRRGESRRARAPGDLSIRGAQRVVDHPLALQQTSAAAAAAEEEEEEVVIVVVVLVVVVKKTKRRR